MKNKAVIAVVLGVVLGVVLTAGIYYVSSRPAVASAEKTSFAEVTAQLDPGGDYYVYLNTGRIIKNVGTYMDMVKKMVRGNEAAASDETEKALTFLGKLIVDAGIGEIDGFGASSVSMENGLSHSKVVLHHGKGKNTGLLWQVMGNEPHAQPELDNLPSSTVMAMYTDFRADVLWSWLKKEFAASGVAEIQGSLPKFEQELQAKGFPWQKLLTSLDGRMGLLVSMDEQKKVTIPLGKDADGKPQSLEIPEMGFAMALKVKDATLFDLLQAKIPGLLKSEEKGVKRLRIPLPPIPFMNLNLQFVQKGNWLLFATSDNLAAAVLDGGKTKLVDTAEFKKFTAHMPTKGNGFHYLSPRFFDVLFGFVDKASGGKAPVGEEQKAFELFKGFIKGMGVYQVTQCGPTGIMTVTNHTFKMEQLLALPLAAALSGEGGLADKLRQAGDKGKLTSTMGTLKTLGMALESYMVDYDTPPRGESLADISAKMAPFYIREMPLKDAWGHDLLYRSQGNRYWIASPGKDGVFEGWEQTGTFELSGPEAYNNDIIYTNGEFVRAPQLNR